MKKAIVTCALTQGFHSRTQTDAMPRTLQEIADQADAAVKAGAAVVRLHAVDEKGHPTTDVNYLRQMIRHVQERVNPVIEVSTVVTPEATTAERVAVLSVKPEIASIVCGSINLGGQVLIQRDDTIRSLTKAAKEQKIVTNLVCFDLSQIYTARRLLDADLVGDWFLFSLVLGAEGGVKGDLRTLLHMVDGLPRGAQWSAAGIGTASRLVMPGALLMGGHARVGFEDNHMLRSKQAAGSNAELVDVAVTVAKAIGRDVADTDESRAILTLA